LAWEAAKQALTMTTDAKIPILIELKYFNGEAELEILLARRVNQVLHAHNLSLASEAGESVRMLKDWLMQSDVHFLILLDGLNEVRPEYRISLLGAIQGLFSYPHSIVVSCRRHDYDDSLRNYAPVYVLMSFETQVR
jgi:hypothetical protein